MSSKKTFRDADRHFLKIRKAIKRASRVLLSNYGKIGRSHIREKARNDFVTIVDQKTQDVLVDSLRKDFPSYGFKAEEEDFTENAERMWIIDPLDGTANYIHEIPAYCIAVGLRVGEEGVLGMVYDPLRDEMFSASRGRGAFLNQKRIHVSKTRKLKMRRSDS